MARAQSLSEFQTSFPDERSARRSCYRHVSFETLLGLASHHLPTSYWKYRRRDDPRKGVPTAGASRGVEGQRQACSQTDQDLPKKSNPAPFRLRPASSRY